MWKNATLPFYAMHKLYIAFNSLKIHYIFRSKELKLIEKAVSFQSTYYSHENLGMWKNTALHFNTTHKSYMAKCLASAETGNWNLLRKGSVYKVSIIVFMRHFRKELSRIFSQTNACQAFLLVVVYESSFCNLLGEFESQRKKLCQLRTDSCIVAP